MKLTIDGKEIEARKGQTLLESALAADVYIPHLCYHPDLPSFKEASRLDSCFRGEEEFRSDSHAEGYQGCGLCLVKIKDRAEPVLSCNTLAEEGMDVLVSDSQIEAFRQECLVSILSRHPHSCLLCAQREGCSLTQCSTNVPEDERCCPQFDYCELRKVSEYVGIREDLSRYIPRHLYAEEDKPLIIRDYNLCIGCLRCVRACENIIGAKALGYVVNENLITVGTTRPTVEESGCYFCGACVEVCPTGALRDKDLKPGDRRASLVPCAASCPVGMDIPSYVKFIAQKEYDKAANLIKQSVPLALSLGHICPHPCEDECRRGKINQPIAICDLKRFALLASEFRNQVHRGKETGKRVSIIGAGPAGLVAAYFLAKFGHSVTVYEAQEEPGGMLRWAIPDYRLPHAVIRQEIDFIKSLGVDILTNTPAKPEDLLEELKQNKCDALFLATGAQESQKIEVEGLSFDGVYWGLEFLRKAKRGAMKELQGKAVVIGGGNVALDVAMTALRLGASKVEVACLESKDEMPAFAWEVQEAREEGIEIHPGWGPRKIKGEGGKAKGVELRRCTSVFDEKGNFCPGFDDLQKTFLDADVVILAVGQRSDISYIPSDWKLHRSEDVTVDVDPETLETTIPGVFAGGEITQGPASAVDAMAAGKRAASAIDKFLGGEGIVDMPSDLTFDRKSMWRGEEKEFCSQERISMPNLALSERCQSFGLVRLGYQEAEALREASRCLRCHLRFLFSSAILPPEKWLEFNPENLDQVPESEGVFQLLDEEKNIIQITGTPHLRQALQEQFLSNKGARFFCHEEDPMFTKRESELIQQFLQRHGHLPPGNEEVDDLF